MTRKTAARAGAAFFAVPAALMMAAGPALAAEGDVVVTNTETVQAYLNASGKLDVARVYEQIAMKGKGSVSLSNPVEPNGLRNLDGFGGFEVKNGNVVGTYEVDGEERLRTVSDYTRSLPLEVDVRYTLDGREVKPGDVVGESGLLKVQYTVRNVTGKPQEVSFDDGTGTSVTATEDVVIPMVGSLSTVVPATFTDVRSAEANMAGDGRGGTKMSFTMTLFGPIGKPEATFGYEAQITDGVVPKASISALPVSPLDSPSFKGGAASYKGGAETGATLTAGATEIDANLLKLRDGAGELLAGLIQLRDGADKLNAGLSGEAAPGARKLSDGAGQLKDGTGKLAAGAGKAKAGSSKLAAGSGELAAGSADLAYGAALLDEKLGAYQVGLTQLYSGIKTLPDNEKYKELLAGIDAIQAAVGQPDQPTTLRGGLTALKSGVTGKLQPGIAALVTGIGTLKGEIDASIANDVPQLISLASDTKTAAYKVALAEGCITAAGSPINFAGNCPDLIAAMQKAGALGLLFDSEPGTVVGSTTLDKGGLKQKLEAASFALNSHAPKTAGETDPGGVLYGLNALKVGVDSHKPGTYGASDAGGLEYGLNALVVGTDDHKPGTYGSTDRGGLAYGLGAIDQGVQTLVNTIVNNVLASLGTPSSDPLTTLRGAAAALNEGSGEIAEGAGQVADGADQVAGGAGQLDSGLGELSSGAGQLDSGAGRLRDGAGQLADGLGEAADGSGKIAEGLGKAADGAPKLEDGAQRLSDEGTKKLVEAGKSTAADYGQKYALIEAGAQRAKTEGMAYGAPADAAGTTAYSFELAGMSGEGGRNMGRTAGAAAIFGLAGAAAFLRRRFV